MTRIRAVTAALLILIVLGLFGYVYVEREMSVYRTPATTDPFVVPPGLSARAVLKILRERGLIADERLTMVYVVLSGNRKALRAGEYLFDKPVTTRGVLDAMVAGAVFLHKFTIPEGLTVAEVGMEWQKQGFGTAEDFAAAAREAGDLVQDIEGNAGSVEGYLFPETYSFAIHTSPRQAIHAMVQRYRAVMTTLESRYPSESWPLNARDTLVLASLVEAEAAVDDERPLIASVFLNRLRRGILLQCDPTVVYALEQSNRYSGRLTSADLRVDSPYNTYKYAGLPPGPIANPGMRSLEAVLRPADTQFLYFVRTTGGRHTFSENLVAHNRAVAAYRAMKGRK